MDQHERRAAAGHLVEDLRAVGVEGAALARISGDGLLLVRGVWDGLSKRRSERGGAKQDGYGERRQLHER